MHYYEAYEVNGHEMAFEVGCALTCIRHIQTPPKLSDVFISDASLKAVFPKIFTDFSQPELENSAFWHFVRAVKLAHGQIEPNEQKWDQGTLGQAFVKVVRQVGWQATSKDLTEDSDMGDASVFLRSHRDASGIDGVKEWAEVHFDKMIPRVLGEVLGELLHMDR